MPTPTMPASIQWTTFLTLILAFCIGAVLSKEPPNNCPNDSNEQCNNMELPATMKLVMINEPGGIDKMQFRADLPPPHPPKDHVLVKNEYAGLNFIDTYHRSGLYKRTTPFIMGQEGGGTIVEFPEDITEEERLGMNIGDRVVYGAFGAYAEYTVSPMDKLVPVPEGIDMQTAVACMTQGLTAHYLSSSVGEGLVKPGDWVLVYSVGSGTGQWTAQMLKLRGYRVIGTTSKAKMEGYDSVEDAKAAFGCDELLVLDNVPGKSYADYNSVNIPKEVMRLTGKKGCKMIIDGIGRATYEISLKSLAKRGLFVSFGNASGAVPAFPVLKLLPQSAYVTRPKLAEYTATREELLERSNEIFTWVQEGKLKIVVDKVFALEEAAKGHQYLEDGMSRGKILFKV